MLSAAQHITSRTARIDCTREVISLALPCHMILPCACRRASADLELHGYRIPAGSLLFVSIIYSLASDPQVCRAVSVHFIPCHLCQVHASSARHALAAVLQLYSRQCPMGILIGHTWYHQLIESHHARLMRTKATSLPGFRSSPGNLSKVGCRCSGRDRLLASSPKPWTYMIWRHHLFQKDGLIPTRFQRYVPNHLAA